MQILETLLDRLAVEAATNSNTQTFVRAAWSVLDEAVAAGEVPDRMLSELAVYALMTLYSERLSDTD